MPNPVLIAGAGPTGLTAALELARQGIAVRIIDRRAEPATTSRAIGVQARTLELLERRGLAAGLIALGNRASGGSIYGGGGRLFRMDFTRIESPYPFILLVSQAETERILREAIGKLGVAIERGVELVGLSQDPMSGGPNPVRPVLRHPDGRLEQAESPWLISAEGAHSLIRTTVGLDFAGKALPQHYLLGDVRIEGDLAESDMHIFSDAGFMAIFPLGGRRYRLIAGLPAAEAGPGAGGHPADPSLEELQATYDERSFIPARLGDLTWSSWFRINSRMVPRLKLGRLFLGGDSAHIHSPAGAQGMNTGIQDMINLGWKLAMVIRGEAPESLLDTYEQDRLPVMREVLDKTEGLTGAIGSENPLVRAAFTRLAPWVGGLGPVQDLAAATMSQVALGYRHSSLSADHSHGGALHAGDRVPDLPARALGGDGWSATSSHRLLDPSRFVLLIAHPDGGTPPSGPAPIREAVAGWGDRVAVVDVAPPASQGPGSRFHSAFGRAGGAFLVRPDGYLGLASGLHSAARDLREYGSRWLLA